VRCGEKMWCEVPAGWRPGDPFPGGTHSYCAKHHMKQVAKREAKNVEKKAARKQKLEAMEKSKLLAAAVAAETRIEELTLFYEKQIAAQAAEMTNQATELAIRETELNRLRGLPAEAQPQDPPKCTIAMKDAQAATVPVKAEPSQDEGPPEDPFPVELVCQLDDLQASTPIGGLSRQASTTTVDMIVEYFNSDPAHEVSLSISRAGSSLPATEPTSPKSPKRKAVEMPEGPHCGAAAATRSKKPPLWGAK